ncbi:MAG: T9SS type A sorting domain-containing protein [Bacteroidales bacterium]|nr:T9SS type A sorting domain-containing protein [Bacteroidales bacterium]
MKNTHKNNALMIMAICGILVFSVPCMVQSQELSWEQINEGGFGYSNTRASGMTVFDGSLYVGTINQVEKAQVWCYDGNTWTQVNNNGFDGSDMAVQGITVFDGQLYVGTTNNSVGCQVWCYENGTTWTQVNVSGFDPDKKAMVARVFQEFDGNLYVGVRNDFETGGIMAGAQVWRYDGGTAWTQVNVDGFGIVPSGNNRSVESMAVYNDILYAGTWNDDDGCQVWRYEGNTTWTQVNVNAFGNMPTSGYSVALAMEVFDEELYVGTRNDITGTEVWRYEDNTDWTQVNNNGFGGTNNWAIWDLTVYNDSLYAGTMNMGDGSQLWRYDSGTSWTQVNNNGFGNSSNSMITSMTVFDEKLCTGTHNTTTFCEVWQVMDSSSSVISISAQNFKLGQNFPNPFNSTTTINFQLPKSTIVNISIYDIRGHLVKTLIDEQNDAGSHSVVWNAENVIQGFYYYKIKIGEFTEAKKCLLLK